MADDAARSATVYAWLGATLYKLLTVSAIGWLLYVLPLSIDWDGTQIGNLMAIIAVVALPFALAYHFLGRNQYRWAYALWLTGVALAIVLASWLLASPLVLVFSSVLPLVAVITIGNWAGVAMTLGLGALVWAATVGLLGVPLSVGEAWLILATGVFNALLGWAARSELVAAAQWSLASFETARRDLTTAREWQSELAQSKADLMQANQELTRLYHRLKTLERIAEEARQAKSEFVANVSHELRTPLNMIIGFADVISHSPQIYGRRLPPSLLTDIAAIRRNAEHLAALVDDVLDLSQVEAGRMALSREWVALAPMLNEAVAVVQGLFTARGLYLEWASDPDMDNSPLPPVLCDVTRIRQVIINLLGNAARFTDEGGVRLRCDVHDREVVISVADTGAGIAEEDQQCIFEPFQQADVSTRRRHGGSGLGLTISKQFVEMHGGRMWLESRLGAGTTIYFSLPLDQPTSPLAIDGHSRMRRAITPDDETGYHLRSSHAPTPTLTDRFVVIDEEEMLPRLLARLLPEVDVEVAPDAPSAIELLRRSPAQALVINTPPFAPPAPELLGNLPFATPVITCWIPGGHAAAQRLGVMEYLIKPLTREKLLASLARLGSAAKTVLVVDDEEDELQLFARMLTTHEPRYSILQVTSGQRALSMLRSRHPDVMLLDLMMPGMNGFQVLAEKANDPAIAAIPTIIVSSRDPVGDPLLGNTLTVTQSAGLSQRHLIACMQALGEIPVSSVVKESRV